MVSGSRDLRLPEDAVAVPLGRDYGRNSWAVASETNAAIDFAADAGHFCRPEALSHLVHVRHLYPGGYLVHHLFFGVLIALPAAFLLAFGARHRQMALLAPAALGIGSAMILDEVTYLVATKATDADYVSRVSLFGAMSFISLAVILLLVLYWYGGD
jgi:hypothetical protein